VNVLPNWAPQGGSWPSSSFLIKYYDNCTAHVDISGIQNHSYAKDVNILGI